MAPTLQASPSVKVPPGALRVVPAIDLPADIKVKDATNVGLKDVYVPPEARVRFPATLMMVMTFDVLPVKLIFLKKLLVVIVNVDDPALTVRFGAFEVEPPVVPKTIVAVAAIFLVNAPPLVVSVKLVAVAISKTVVEAVVLVNAMFADPKVMERVLELLELKMPVLNVKVLSASVPAVSVNVLVAPSVQALPSVKVDPAALKVTSLSVFPPLVSVDAASIVNAPV